MSTDNNDFAKLLDDKSILDNVTPEELEDLRASFDGDVSRLRAFLHEKKQKRGLKGRGRINPDYEVDKEKPSILVTDTTEMERTRRLLEQEGHRKQARVNAREHSERELDRQMGVEASAQDSLLQHPALDNQRFDGIDPNVNPEPPLNSEARREFDNAQREQEMEKQHRLGNMPKFSSAPKPHGPG